MFLSPSNEIIGNNHTKNMTLHAHPFGLLVELFSSYKHDNYFYEGVHEYGKSFFIRYEMEDMLRSAEEEDRYGGINKSGDVFKVKQWTQIDLLILKLR